MGVESGGIGAEPGLLTVDGAGVSVHALQHRVEGAPERLHLRAVQASAVEEDGGLGLVAFRQFVEAEAELLGIGQPGGVVQTDQLGTRLYLLAWQEGVEGVNTSAQPRPCLQHGDAGSSALQLVGAAEAAEACADHQDPQRRWPGCRAETPDG